MSAVNPVRYDPPRPVASPFAVDQRVFLHGLCWADYERLLEVRGECASPRLTYLNGALELMTPSSDHQGDKKQLARLVEAWAEETNTELEGFGSWTLKSPLAERGAEPDECYVLGPLHDKRTLPDFVIEVVRSSGGIDKLEVYRGLRVSEVWFWQDGRLRFYGLNADGSGYTRSARSRWLPGLDPELLERCMREPTQTSAVRRLRAELRG